MAIVTDIWGVEDSEVVETTGLETKIVIPLEDSPTVSHYVDGYSLTCNYFNQINSVNDSGTEYDISVPMDSLRYNKIDNAVIKLSTPLDIKVDEDYSGEAIVDFNIIPLISDVIIASIGLNKFVMLTVTEVKLNKYTNSKIYNITFNKSMVIDLDDIILEDLDNRADINYIYNKDFISERSAPILVKSVYDKKVNRKALFVKLFDYYVKKFRDPETLTFTTPTEDKVSDDNVGYIMYLLSRKHNMSLVDIKYQYTNVSELVINILTRNKLLLNTADRKMSFEYKIFSNPYSMALYRGSTMRYVNISDSTTLELEYIEDNEYTPNFTDIGGNYLFTDTFIDGGSDNPLEELLTQYMNNEPLDNDKLLEIAENIVKLDAGTQFFYLPYVLILLTYSNLNIGVVV
jgi:hypothetical protein